MKQVRFMKIMALAALLVGFTATISAQTTGNATASVTISAVALLAVNTAAAPTFSVVAPAAAGQLPLITPAGGPTYLQYTSVVATGVTKKITAACTPAMLNGLKLDVWAAAPTGTGDVGALVAGGLIVNAGYTAGTAADLITSIASCATGSGTTQGPAVYYTLSIDAATFALMEVTGATTFTITYSLVDA